MRTKLLMAIALFIVAGCARYHTRMFILDERIADTGQYEIDVSILAYRGAVHIENYNHITDKHEFGVTICIEDTLHPVPEYLMQLDPQDHHFVEVMDSVKNAAQMRYDIESAFLEYLPSGDRIMLPVKEDLQLWKFGRWGVQYSFGRVTIPAGVDSLMLTVPYRSHDSLSRITARDTLVIRTHRHESAKIGPLLD